MRVHEAGAAGREVVGGRVAARRARRRGSPPVDGKRHVRRDRGDDQEVEVGAPRRPPARAPRARRAARCPRAPRPARRRAARGCPCARRSTRRRCRPSSQLVVRDHALGHVRAEPGDRDGRRRSAVPITTAPPRRSASRARRARRRPWPSPCPGRSGRGRARRRTSSSSSSPGSTMRLKRTSSIPAKSASLPRFSSCEARQRRRSAPSPRPSSRPA